MRVTGELHVLAMFMPGKGPQIPIGQDTGWVPRSVLMQSPEEKSSTPARDHTLII
jgi:hypothetical protein